MCVYVFKKKEGAKKKKARQFYCLPRKWLFPHSIGYAPFSCLTDRGLSDVSSQPVDVCPLSIQYRMWQANGGESRATLLNAQ